MQRANHLPLIVGLNWSFSSSSSSASFSCFSSGRVIRGISLVGGLFAVTRLRTTEFGIKPSGANGQ